jgi:hypothetical protein
VVGLDLELELFGFVVEYPTWPLRKLRRKASFLKDVCLSGIMFWIPARPARIVRNGLRLDTFQTLIPASFAFEVMKPPGTDCTHAIEVTP